MKDDNGKITIKSIWKFLRSDKGKKYSFIIFYAIFFIFLFVFLTMPVKETKIEKEKEEEINSLPFITKKLEDNNYNFTYKEIINDNTIEFQGVKENNLISISNERDKYDYIYQNGKLTKTNELNPLEYYKLLDIYELKTLIKSSTLITKVEFPNTSEYNFNYDIDSNTLNNLFEKEGVLENSLNRIVVNCNKDFEVKKISIDIYNYLKEINKEDTDITSYLIEIEFLEDA